LDNNWFDSIKNLNSLNLGIESGGKHQWYADERFSSEKILKYKQNNEESIILLKRNNGQNGFRIDRSGWGYDPKLVKEGYYFDSHSLRPYHQYKNEIDKLVNLIL
jgi:hypothetical protein